MASLTQSANQSFGEL